jgi:hypothetical protein
MDAKQESALYWMKVGRKVLEGPVLEECDRDIKKVEEWAAAGTAGLPPGIGEAIRHQPINHESLDGLKCLRCGIEKIYWEHFPDCSRFKPSWDPVRAAFKDEQPSSRGTMTPKEQNIFDEWIERVKEWMGRPDASPSFIESCKEHIKVLEWQRDSSHTMTSTSKKPKINPRPDIP